MSYGTVPKGPDLKAQFQRKKLGTFEFLLYPELWSELDCRAYYCGKQWAEVHFSPRSRELVPAESGIYMFVSRSGYSEFISDHSYVLYVGKATSLNSRYYSYIREQRYLLDHTRERVAELLDHFEGWLYFRYILVPASELDQAENLLKDNLTPPGNTQLKIIGRLQEPMEL